MKLSDQFREELAILKALKGKERLQHLFQYYKWRILAIVLCFAILLSAVVNAIIKKDYVLTGILLNYTEDVSGDKLSALTSDFLTANGIDEKEYTLELITSLSYLQDNAEFATDSYMAVENLTARVTGKMLDFVVCDLDTIENLAYSEFFVDLSTVLTKEQMEAYAPYLLYMDMAFVEKIKEIVESENYDVEIELPDSKKPETMEKPIPVFIDISGSDYSDAIYPGEKKDIVLAIAVNAPHEEMLREFVDFLMK